MQETQDHKDRALHELAALLANDVGSRGLGDYIPKDIIVYLVNWWA